MPTDAFRKRVGDAGAAMAAGYADLVSHVSECATCSSAVVFGMGAPAVGIVCVEGRRLREIWFTSHNMFMDARLARTVELQRQREAAAHAR